MEIRSNFKFILLFGVFLISSVICSPVLAQIPPASVKITTPLDSAKVPSGELTIYGTSADDDTKNCQVFADWNDLRPMQNVTPQGPNGNEDYSKWSYTYTSGYHNIVEGSNELTSKITCYDQAQNEISKSYSINVTGKNEKTVQQSDVNTDTKKEDATISPVQNIKRNNGNDSVQQSDVNTDTKKEDANILSVQNTKGSGTYKILPLYTESNEKVAGSDSSRDGDKTGVTSTDKSESQDIANTNIANTNVKTLSSEQQQDSKDNNNTSETQDSHIPVTDNNVNAVSSEQQQDSKANNNTSETQDAHIPMTDSNVKAVSSEHPQVSKETTVSDTSKSPAIKTTDRKLTADTNRIFTFEPNLPADEKITRNHNNPLTHTADSDSLLNHNNEASSVFGLKIKTSNQDTKDTKTELDNKIQKLQERIADKTHLFGLVG